MKNRHSYLYWASTWLPVFLCIAVIFCESTESLGANHTTEPLRLIWERFFGRVADMRWELIHHYLRKSGHFIGYGIIGLCWLRAWWKSLPQSHFLLDATLAMAGTAFIASCDEFHQSLLPNRTGSPWDVLLDCCGALTLQLIVYILARIFLPKRLANHQNELITPS